MSDVKKRKEVSLTEETIALLEAKAKLEGRKLKNYMEHVLHEDAHDFVVTEGYKKMMDEVLEKHRNGENEYIPWTEVKSNLKNLMNDLRTNSKR